MIQYYMLSDIVCFISAFDYFWVVSIFLAPRSGSDDPFSDMLAQFLYNKCKKPLY